MENKAISEDLLLNEDKTVDISQTNHKIYHWYERDESLLKAEKTAMHKAFPNFTLDKLDDGRLAWIGSLNVGILGDNEWHIMAVYNHNHPHPVMGGTVRVYLITPDIDELICECQWATSKLLKDSNGQFYLCTFDVDNLKIGNVTTSAAAHIAMAVKWFMAFELVLIGELTKEEFSADGII